MSDAAPPPGDNRVKVLFLSVAGHVGGAERSLYELLVALPTERIDARACVPPEGNLGRLCAIAEVPVHPIAMRRFRRTRNPIVLFGQIRALFNASQAVRQICKDNGIDVIHANSDSAALVAWEVHRETGIPFVWHCRDIRPLGPLSHILAKSTGSAVAISNAVAQHLKEQGLEDSRVRVVLNGIDLPRFHGPESRDEIRGRTRAYLGIDPAAPLLIDIGNWVPWKRHELFLEALALVREKYPTARGLLVGSDLFMQNAAYAELLEQRSEDLNLDDGTVLVLQQREDVPDLLAASDILVSPSDREPFGRVLVEAAASGVPVVSTRSGAKPEIVLDGLTGLLTPAGEARPIAEACLKLIGDPEFAQVLGTRARARAQECFDVNRTASEMAALFEEIARIPRK